MPEKKYIRFINSDYKTLFHLPDGGRIRITYPDREPAERVCRFIDEYHTDIGGHHYHICEFAERMEQIGAKYEPQVLSCGKRKWPWPRLPYYRHKAGVRFCVCAQGSCERPEVLHFQTAGG